MPRCAQVALISQVALINLTTMVVTSVDLAQHLYAASTRDAPRGPTTVHVTPRSPPGMAKSSIRRGLKELESIEEHGVELSKTRIRRPGGGRKKLEDKHAELLGELRGLVEATTRGDSESPLLRRKQRLPITLMENRTPEAGQ